MSAHPISDLAHAEKEDWRRSSREAELGVVIPPAAALRAAVARRRQAALAGGMRNPEGAAGLSSQAISFPLNWPQDSQLRKACETGRTLPLPPRKASPT